MGQYESANKYLQQLKVQILNGEHPEYYQELNLDEFEREWANTNMINHKHT